MLLLKYLPSKNRLSDFFAGNAQLNQESLICLIGKNMLLEHHLNTIYTLHQKNIPPLFAINYQPHKNSLMHDFVH